MKSKPHFKISLLRQKLLDWYDTNDRRLPWRLDYKKSKDPYIIWVSEIMLQQTQISSMIPVYLRFMQAFPTLKDLAAANEEQIREAVRGLGYYRRFSFLHKAAIGLVASTQKNVAWPQTFEQWQDLPGIGPYTAAALASIVNAQPHMVVDGNVERVFARLLDIREDVTTPKWKLDFKVWGDTIVDPVSPGDFNQAVMELGQLICSPRSPKCDRCPIHYACKAKKNGSTELSPGQKKKKAFVSTKLNLIVPIRDGEIGISQRPQDAKFLKGIEGFPTILETDKDQKTLNLESIGKIKHSITKHKIEARVSIHHHTPKTCKQLPNIRFVKLKDLEPQLTSNLDRKALKLLLSLESDLGLSV